MSAYQRGLVLAGTLELSLVVLNGCTTMHTKDGQLHVGDSINIYAMFDNSRDWGPSYLIGPPGHHFGMGARIDDMRTDPPITSGRIDDIQTSAMSSPVGRSLRIIPDEHPTDNALH